MNAITMGYDIGPEHGYRPGDVGAAPALVGHIPSVQARVRAGRMGKVDDVIGRISIFVVFVMWVVIPVLGGLNIILGP
ncbi:hypothetical protein SAMN04515671_4105 [Nakamurella panacisegetis]|uniref:Uncharacterized protein n=1 Tax=Nakamurella panacisegetis TaxID=1090615 RepID=A0A1H0SJ10_9ACTN|nr:hypothetical protein [Nakamurella panacisegetis]SDP41136.1 hypothetical protein SAMN04515671_4105 [Nakamurella panacisegetis]